uniref:Uncharacterized protein n=1 Tax=uncultured marine virus TaxID=186617 RepID=A0A0F7L8F5_9VIRU|nr:hypothetical protein [uncultured marine virus]
MFLSRTDEIRAISESSLTPADGYETGFLENLNTSIDAVRFLDTHRAEQDAIIKVLEPFVENAGIDHNPGFFRDALNGSSRARATGRFRQFDEIDEASMPEAPFYEYRMRLQKMNAALEAKGKPTISEEQVNEKAREIALKARSDQQDISSRSTTMGDVGSLLGGAYSDIRSLLRSPAAPSLVAGASVKAGILKTALVEGVIGASQVALAQPDVAKWYGSLGLKYTSEDFQRNVFSAFIGGAAFGGLIKGVIKGAPIARDYADPVGALGREISKQVDETSLFEVDQALRDMSEKDAIAGLKALEKAGVPINNEAAAVIRQVANDDADENPLLGDGLDAQAEHLERQLAVELALDADEIPVLTDKPAIPPKVHDDINHYDNLDDTIFRFEPDEIGVDAKTFQYKSGGDQQGVTNKYRATTVWDPFKAGQVLVYEYADGRKVIADGHQRLGMAKRIKAADPSQKVILYGSVLREQDGITPEMAMVIAARKNITEAIDAPGDKVIDAAKLERSVPGALDDPSLPVGTSLIRTARDLVNLSDENFGMVVNEIVPVNYAAIVGRLVDDPAKQNAILRILAETNPANVTQAEAIVRQARQIEFREATQEGLFGTEEFTQSLFAERAKVLDATLKRLRNDKKVFNSLVENQNRIEAEGNQLNADSNISRSMTDGQALEIIKAQADRKGGIADALNLAARELADGRPLTEVSRNVADAVRRAIADGDIDGSTVSLEGRGIDVEAEGDRLAAGPERLDEFDEPNGKGSQDQADASEATLREETAPVQPEVALEDITNSIPLDATPAEKVAALQELTATNRPIIDAFLEKLDAKYGTKSKSNEKLPEKILEKSTRPSILASKPWHNVEHIRDSLRFKTQLDDIQDLPAIINELRSGLGVEIIKADVVKFIAPKEWGFRIVAFDLRMRNGQIVEYYLPIREIEEVKDVNHKLFEKWRNEDVAKLSAAQENAMRGDIAESFDRYQSAFDDYLARTGQSESEVAAALNNSVDASGPTMEKSVYISSTVNESAFSQTPLTRSATDPGISTNARPSSETPATNDLSITGTSDINIGGPSRVRNVESTAQGEQTLIEGVAPITSATRAQAGVDAPLTGGARPMDEGLFDTGSRAQMDLLDMAIPVGQRIDDAGEIVAETQSVRDILTEFDNDKSMLDRLKDCV